jgi:hypothetical protein
MSEMNNPSDSPDYSKMSDEEIAEGWDEEDFKRCLYERVGITPEQVTKVNLEIDPGKFEAAYREFKAEQARWAAEGLVQMSRMAEGSARLLKAVRESGNVQMIKAGEGYAFLMPEEPREYPTGRVSISEPADQIDELLRESLKKLKAREDALLIELGERAYFELLGLLRDGEL